jgi:hypothetical protein
MAKAITLMVRACLFCQPGKVHKQVHLQPAEIPVPHRRFASLPPSRGHTYLLTIIDRTSRWLEGPLRQLGIPVWCSRHHQIGQGGTVQVCPVGGPLQSAQHPVFTHDSITSSIKWIGRAVPQAAEGRLAAADWHDHLPWVLLGIRASFSEESEFSPA